jgi:putative transposase
VPTTSCPAIALRLQPYYFTLMSEKYKIHDSQQLYFVSFATVNWMDVFTRRLYNDIFVASLRYCQQHKGL